jgi:molybdopterin synthase sulfur carrier subunit
MSCSTEPTMKLNVLYFARLREALGRDRESIEVPAGVTTVAQLRAWLVARGEPFATAFGEIKRIRAAVDQTMVADDAALTDGAEVAFFPPVTGG